MFPCLHAFVEKANYIHFFISLSAAQFFFSGVCLCVCVFPAREAFNKHATHLQGHHTPVLQEMCICFFAILLLVPIKSTKEDVICSRLEIFHSIITSAFPSQWRKEEKEETVLQSRRVALGHFISMAALITSGPSDPPVVFCAIVLSLRRTVDHHSRHAR